MSQTRSRRLTIFFVSTGFVLLLAAAIFSRGGGGRVGKNVDVLPDGDIQAAIEEVARWSGKGTVRVHAGTYRPKAPGQALIYFNARHDGITVEAVGNVVLTAENREISDPGRPGYPAVVNHVVYFGDGITRATTFRGFKVTGANGFILGPQDLITVRTTEDLTKSAQYESNAHSPIESNNNLPKSHYFYADGGGILVYGRSYPTIENVEIYNNYSSVCGGGASVQYPRGEISDAVLFKNCVFRGNRAAVSGSAVDLLIPGSSAVFENCLFVGNLSNTDLCMGDKVAYGALSVFPGCRATVSRCTFTGNRNGVDDRGAGSTYSDTIFWRNDTAGGKCETDRFEIHVASPGQVSGCVIGGKSGSVPAEVSRSENTLESPDPAFDDAFHPHHEAYTTAGCRNPGHRG